MSAWISDIFEQLTTQLLDPSTCWILVCKPASSLPPSIYSSNTVLSADTSLGQQTPMTKASSYTQTAASSGVSRCLLRTYLTASRGSFLLPHIFPPYIYIYGFCIWNIILNFLNCKGFSNECSLVFDGLKIYSISKFDSWTIVMEAWSEFMLYLVLPSKLGDTWSKAWLADLQSHVLSLS